MNHKNEKYGLFTAIAMIVGICIGSGIFFKSDNILIATNGSIILGVLVFAIGAIAIIFGGLCFSELASRTSKPGGVVTYMDEFSGKRSACSFGWFQTFIYYPTLTAVVSWVVGIYTCILFNLKNTLEQQILIGSAFLIICYVYNTLSAKIGGIFQNAATIIKLIPLALLAVFGFIFGNPMEGLQNVSPSHLMGLTWISAIGPIAFAFDGWVVSTSIAHEVKNSKKNMPRALIIAPFIILACYVLYFIGITTFVGTEKVLEMGDVHVQYAAQQLFGSLFAKAITVFVVISVMGTLNGLVLGFIRMPYSMAIREGMFPFAKKLSIVNKKFNMPVYSAVFASALSAFWMVLHYLTTKFKLLPNSDVSEISIAVSYVFYILLYYRVFQMYKRKEIKSVWKGIVYPIFATIGSLIILYGAFQSKLFLIYAAICVLVIVASIVFYTKKMKKIKQTIS
ncbi:amino acid permease [Paludicola sp. MB14-C6]|uniref:APC family permease n=1 Tax=Paludihabitans sp. MB14-C6 TaxID=3070656 RepID=UPI0027DB9C0B|nr:amino acid permease [Paludicola sp. MB14-C6]WMJ22850.1 amino acid permease [Paludicola sp. MB14-C6]